MQPFNPFDPQLKADPYALFKQYRENAPVSLGCSTSPGYADTWYFFGFEEARQLLRCKLSEPGKRAESALTHADARSQIWKHLSGWPLFQDPPIHTHRRALLAGAFREPALARLQYAHKQHAEDLLQQFHRRGHQQIDIVTEFAYPLAVGAISRVLGIPAPDTTWFKAITRKISDVLDLGYVEAAYEPGLEALKALIAYVEEMIIWKSTHLGDDLLSALIRPDKGSPQLSAEVLTQMATQILFAGQETVADGIGNGVFACMEQPQQLALLRSKPELLANFTTEVLRYRNPVLFTGSRILEEDFTCGDISIKAGEPTIIALAACNRDSRRFTAPDQFNIQRDLGGTELSFGHGIHYCLGAHHARQVMQVGFAALLQHLPAEWQLASPVNWRPNSVLNGPLHLKLALN